MNLNDEITRRMTLLSISQSRTLAVSTYRGIESPSKDVRDCVTYIEEENKCTIYHVIEGPELLSNRFFMLAISNDSNAWNSELVALPENRFKAYAYFGSYRQYHYEPGYITIERHGNHYSYVANPNLRELFSSVPCPGKKVK